jgi:hypothetical protein
MKSGRPSSDRERYQAFVREGIRADEAMRRSGRGYRAVDVHSYLDAKVAGRPVRRPRLARWR